jgi:hypothetical protein
MSIYKMGKNKKETNCCNTKRKLFYVAIGVILLLVLIFTLPKYFTGDATASGTQISSEISKIEIIHFHGTNQCSSCITVGNFAEETMNTYFSNELESEKIIFTHINAELPENYALANKYGVTGSSLWIGTYYKDGKFSKEENINVWYKIKDKQDYMDYLKGVIEQKLFGN